MSLMIDSTTLQFQVRNWLDACFGAEIANDRQERNHRFIEEAIELVQACGCTRAEVLQLVDYVYARPAGEIRQEVGGVMVTLVALCLANRQSLDRAAIDEVARIWEKIDQIRAKQAAKPKFSPLPAEQRCTPWQTYCDACGNNMQKCAEIRAAQALREQSTTRIDGVGEV